MSNAMTPRRPSRAQQDAEYAAKLEAELRQTIDLVTAMFWNLECGEVLSNEQITACRYDRVLGVLWWRIWDHAEYVSRTRPLHRVARDDDTSRFIEDETSRSCDRLKQQYGSVTAYMQEIRAAALAGHPKARAMRRRYVKVARHVPQDSRMHEGAAA